MIDRVNVYRLHFVVRRVRIRVEGHAVPSHGRVRVSAIVWRLARGRKAGSPAVVTHGGKVRAVDDGIERSHERRVR